MPQFDSATYLSQIFWLIITFFSLYAFIQWIVFPNLNSIFKKRAEAKEQEVLLTEQIKKETETETVAYQAYLKDAEKEATSLIQQTYKEMQAFMHTQIATHEKKLRDHFKKTETELTKTADSINSLLQKKVPDFAQSFDEIYKTPLKNGEKNV